jgi:glutamate 5-kinase
MQAEELERRERLAPVRRLVVKIGSSSLTTRSRQLDRGVLRQLVADVVQLRQRGIQVAIVSSGAVAAGMGRLGLEHRPRAIADLQAVAAVGQCQLMDAYKALFWRSGVPVGQVLLTADDILGNRRRYLNLEGTFRSLFSYGAVPVINENDSVAVAELRRQIGENDMLAAYVANLIGAQLLVMLSDVDGLYAQYRRGGPRSKPLELVRSGDAVLQPAESTPGSSLGSGGIQTKLRAARLLLTCGEMCVLAHARRHRLLEIMEGKTLGTLFVPAGKRLRQRKRWIGFASTCAGRLVVDKGAQRAVAQHDRSLLPAGVLACHGEFGPGDTVHVENERGEEFARGLVRYASVDLAKVLGQSSPEIQAVLGYPAREVIHRDDLVLLI